MPPNRAPPSLTKTALKPRTNRTLPSSTRLRGAAGDRTDQARDDPHVRPPSCTRRRRTVAGRRCLGLGGLASWTPHRHGRISGS